MLIDIHTHRTDAESLSIYDISSTLKKIPPKFSECQFFSAGLHPWNLNEHSFEKIEEIRVLAEEKKIIAIGECGIDRVCKTNLDLQIDVFKKQIQIAVKYNLPLIVHCVKAYSDLLSILKNSKELPKIIFHDFKADSETIGKIIGKNRYFSFGRSLLLGNRKAIEALKIIPKEKLFLETDKADISIEKVFIEAADYLGCSKENLLKQITENFHHCFG